MVFALRRNFSNSRKAKKQIKTNMKNMKTIKTALPYLVGGVLFLCAGRTSAQMTVGRVVQYSVEKKVSVDAPLDRVWDSLSNLTALPRYANGYITAVTREGNTSVFDFTMKDGSVVKGKMDYIEPRSDDRFCTITLIAPLPQGIQNIEWLLTVKDTPDGDGTIVRWAAVIDGSDDAKAAVKQQATEMFDDYFKGLAGFFKVKQV